jgi:hypothetical protein
VKTCFSKRERSWANAGETMNMDRNRHLVKVFIFMVG